MSNQTERLKQHPCKDAVQVKPKTWLLVETAIVFASLYLLFASSFALIGRELAAARGVDYSFLVHTPIDSNIPFRPEFTYVYISEWLFPLMFGVAWFLKVPPNQSLIRRIFVMYLCLYGLSAMCWVIMPVSCQAIFPPEAQLNATTAGIALWEHKATGTMWNAFPSFHCLTIWLFFRLAQKQIRFKPLVWLMGILGTAVVASTLFIKVHYLVDVVAGIAMAEIGVRYFCDSQRLLRLFSMTNDRLFACMYIFIFVIVSICLSRSPFEKDYRQLRDCDYIDSYHSEGACPPQRKEQVLASCSTD